MYKKTAIASLGVALLLLSACAPEPAGPAAEEAAAPEQQEVDSGVIDTETWDIRDLCGDEEITVALADGTGGNTWRQIVIAELEDEAAKCDNITEVLYSNANADPQKANADINGFVAQGVDIIIVLPDFGDSQLPALRSAMQAGVTVVPYFAGIGGTPGTDYSVNVPVDSRATGLSMAAWFGENLESGNVAYMGGFASCPSCQATFEGLKEGLAAFPNLTLVGDTFVATDYNPELAERAIAGLISQYGDIQGLSGDYGVVALGALNAYTNAGKPLPALAVAAGQNSVYCAWEEKKNAGEEFAFAAFETTTQVVRVALRHGLAQYYGVEWGEPTAVRLPESVNTAKGVMPPCDPSLPGDTDMFSGLTLEQLQEVLG